MSKNDDKQKMTNKKSQTKNDKLKRQKKYDKQKMTNKQKMKKYLTNIYF